MGPGNDNTLSSKYVVGSTDDLRILEIAGT
jgi:hypothetical protein